MPRGRNKELIERRNQKIAERWYYWTEMQNLRFDRALTILSQDEFFLSEDRILTILRDYAKMFPEKKIRTRVHPKVPRLTARQLSLFPDFE